MQSQPKVRWKLLLLAMIIMLLTSACMQAEGFSPPGMMGRGMGPGMMDSQYAPPPATTPVPTATPGGEATVSYRQDVQPIFEQYCVVCHGGSSGLWLDSYEHIMAGGSGGAVVRPGDAEASQLYLRLTGQSQLAMPLGQEPLSADNIDLIRSWIVEGAPNN